ncbi:MAG: hypothetical protein ACREOJ_10300 [Gemmatimonadaceae bacterium]
MTLRRVARTHAILLLILCAGCLVAPVPVLSWLRISAPSFAALALAYLTAAVNARRPIEAIPEVLRESQPAAPPV